MAEHDIRLPDPTKLVVSSSPHFHSRESVSRIMLIVILALLPACIAGVVFFGVAALTVLLVSAAACVGFEWLFCKWLGKPSALGDYSALLTGILLGMNLSASTPWWVCVIGALLAIGLGKQIYGGLGYNPFNPALVARVGLLIAFPSLMTQWPKTRFAADAVSGATPLGDWKTNGVLGADYWDYFVGNIGGCIGETSALALLVGGGVLIAYRLIRWEVPAAFIGTVGALSAILWLTNADAHPTPLFHILTGGLFLGAFFMATDMVTSPMSRLGAAIFGAGCGLITIVIRAWGAYPEGVSFSILFMNALVPLIDRYTAAKPFGQARPEKVAA